LLAVSSTVERASADRLAAIITGMRALSQGASGELARGPVVQVLIEMANAYLFVSSISGGSTLGVVAARNCDLGLVGYEIAMLVDRVGAQLTPGLVIELKNSLVQV
jgi:predicted regulator of Ras-like GTPase activity (Roadblock/LC7/MglB family)